MFKRKDKKENEQEKEKEKKIGNILAYWRNMFGYVSRSLAFYFFKCFNLIIIIIIFLKWNAFKFDNQIRKLVSGSFSHPRESPSSGIFDCSIHQVILVCTFSSIFSAAKQQIVAMLLIEYGNCIIRWNLMIAFSTFLSKIFLKFLFYLSIFSTIVRLSFFFFTIRLFSICIWISNIDSFHVSLETSFN